jgi:hypothetical protein
MEKLFEGREAQTLDIDDAAAYEKNATVWSVNGMHALPHKGELPAHAGRPGEMSSMRHMLDAYGSYANAETIMMAYLDNMNNMINDQRDVMLGYLGAGAAISRAAAAPRQFVVGGVPGQVIQAQAQVTDAVPAAAAPVEAAAAIDDDEDANLP